MHEPSFDLQADFFGDLPAPADMPALAPSVEALPEVPTLTAPAVEAAPVAVVPTITERPESAFLSAIMAAGLTPPEFIEPNGTLHRFSSNGKRGDKSGWYVLHLDGVPAGIFGCWRAGLTETWCSKPDNALTEAEKQAMRQRVQAAQAARDAAQVQARQQAQATAQARWDAASPATAGHSYLVAKGVQAHGLRLEGDKLVIPLCDVDGVQHSLQTIAPNGEKRFLTDGKKKGCFYGLGQPGPVLVICEGFATGASIHEATGLPVMVGFDAYNLLPVAQALRTKYPDTRLILAADNDTTTEGNPGLTKGTEAAQVVAGVLALAVSSTAPEKKMDFNDLHQAEGLEAVARLIESAAMTQAPTVADTGGDGNAWPELVPLPEDTDSMGAPQPFPFAAMGDVLGAAALAIAEDVQAPDAMAGGSVLAAASLAVQSLADVVLPHGQVSPLSIFCVTSGSSGDRKSAVDAVACMEIARRRKEQSRQHHHALEAYRQEQASHKKGDPEPEEPMLQSLTVGNATVEGVSRLLKGQSSVGVFSAEGGEVLGGHSMKEVNRMGAMAFFLKAWSAESLDVMRGGTGYTSLLGRRMALHIMVQPMLLGQLLSDPLADGQGFLARCLIAQPSTLAGTRLYNGSNPMEHPAVVAYAQRMGHLLDTKPELWPNGDGYELKPKTLHLDPEARALWIAFYNAIEVEQADSKELAQARAFASKAAEQAARIAGVITLFNDPHAHEIDEPAMFGAMELMKFYLSEHLRLMGTGKQEQADKRLRVLWDWLQGQGPIVQGKDVLQRCPNALRKLKAKGINQLLDDLAQRGYVRQIGKGWEVRNVV